MFNIRVCLLVVIAAALTQKCNGEPRKSQNQRIRSLLSGLDEETLKKAAADGDTISDIIKKLKKSKPEININLSKLPSLKIPDVKVTLPKVPKIKVPDVPSLSSIKRNLPGLPSVPNVGKLTDKITSKIPLSKAKLLIKYHYLKYKIKQFLKNYLKNLLSLIDKIMSKFGYYNERNN